MKYLIIFLLFSMMCNSGCFYIGQNQAADVAQSPSSTWSELEALSIAMESFSHNLFDENSPNIKVSAMISYPATLVALERRKDARTKAGISEEEYRTTMDELAEDCLGIFIDWKKHRFVDSKGNYLRSVSQLNRLEFTMILNNNSWPCTVPVLLMDGFMVPLASFADWPCYIPDIHDIESRIFLENERGERLTPYLVWGRNNNILTLEETIVVRFEIPSIEHNFWGGSSTVWLALEGFDANIRLPFALSDNYFNVQP